MKNSDVLQAPSALLQSNLDALKRKYPAISAQIEAFPMRHALRALPSRDGSVFYGLAGEKGITPITNPHAPMTVINQQLAALSDKLTDFTRPILIVGLYPGIELLYLFEQCEKVTTPHCPQPIFVCMDSPACLLGFLQTWDARALINSPRVRFFLAEEMEMFVERLRADPAMSHTFTLISGAPQSTLDQVMPPLARLVAERDIETARLQKENNEWYDAISDADLAAVIAGKGGRRPRLLMPTCSWSTFLQHSTRDACRAFEELGWETRVLKTDMLLTPYHLALELNRFKPDVFLLIDHLRCEAEEAYPRNMMFVTWVQDEMDHIFSDKSGRRTSEYAAERKRDLVVGYVAALNDPKFAYPRDRLVQIGIPANPRVFHPVTLTPEQKSAYSCELAFVTHASMPSERIVEETIIPAVQSRGISADTVTAIHDRLWREYRAGRTLTDRAELLGELARFPEFTQAWAAADECGREELLRLFYWRLNDTIYRHVVLEWADELGLDMHLYGNGWEHHPRFCRYAKGPVSHGTELNCVYQAAKFNLHLNIAQGMHQRIWEILASGARPLFRETTDVSRDPLPRQTMRSIARCLLDHDSSKPLDKDAAEWLFKKVLAAAKACEREPDREPEIKKQLHGSLRSMFCNRLDLIVDNWDELTFHDKDSLGAIVYR